MEHDLVVREGMTEKYLLNELDPELRDQFEEHFFACEQCGLDVRAAAEFVEQSKVILAEKPEVAAATASRARSGYRGWLTWLRPAFAAPALALLLAVVGYQNLVTYPHLKRTQTSPEILPWAPVNIGTWGAAAPVITIAPGQGFVLFVRIPPEGGYSSYAAELRDAAGKIEWSLTIPATAGQDQWSIAVPGAEREGGAYSLVVRGKTASGESKEVGRTSFELQIQK